MLLLTVIGQISSRMTWNWYYLAIFSCVWRGCRPYSPMECGAAEAHFAVMFSSPGNFKKLFAGSPVIDNGPSIYSCAW